MISLEKITNDIHILPYSYCSQQQMIINRNLKKNFLRNVTTETIQRLKRLKDKNTQVLGDMLESEKPKNEQEHLNLQNFRTDILRELERQEKNKSYFAEGFAGKIYVIELPLENNIKKLTVIKKSKRSGEYVDNTAILHEYNYHSQASNFFTKSPIYGIDTPQVYGTINGSEGEILLVMEYIEGLTIFSYKNISTLLYIISFLQKNTLPSYDDLIKKIETTLSQNPHDTVIKELMIEVCDEFSKDDTPLIKDFFEKYISDIGVPYTIAKDRIQGTFFEKYLVNIFDKLSKDVSIGSLDEDTKMAIKDRLQNSILGLNKVLYHNDTNTRNVILGENGKIYLIDYDKADTRPSLLLTKKYKESLRTNYEKHNGKENIYDLEILNHFTTL